MTHDSRVIRKISWDFPRCCGLSNGLCCLRCQGIWISGWISCHLWIVCIILEWTLESGCVNEQLVGGWATPLKNMSSSVGIILPNILKNKIHAANHQPDKNGQFIDELLLGQCLGCRWCTRLLSWLPGFHDWTCSTVGDCVKNCFKQWKWTLIFEGM